MGSRFCCFVRSGFAVSFGAIFLLLVSVAAVQGTASELVIPRLSGGAYHSLALKSNGTVWAWGSNGYGQLGNVDTEDSIIPTEINDFDDIIAITGGSFHNLALRSDGTVWAWGYNKNGQLGNGTIASSSVPVQVSDLSDVIAIDVGEFYLTNSISNVYPAHSIALKSDGTVWAWGQNWYGQLGNGTATGSTVPIQVEGLGGVTAIAAGGAHNLALKSDGTVWAWGSNGYGQLGNGTTTSSFAPVQVSDLGDVIAVACGYDHSLALKSDGTAWAWGYNADGQLGNGSRISALTPVQISELSDITFIAGGGFHSLALKLDGTVWAWGSNWRGQLGNGKSGEGSNATTPIQVSGLSDITAIAGGLEHSLALRLDGTVWAWGYNKNGQLGNGKGGNYETEDKNPVQTIINVDKIGTSTSGAESLIIATQEIKLCTGSKEKGDVLGSAYAIITASGSDFTVEGAEVTARVKKASKKFISISPKKVTTGVNGQARFKITAKKKNVNKRIKVTFKSGSLKKTLKVTLDKSCFASEQ